ncbi:50S ribosomal protein L11 methyltransferase [Balneatrix alpica]|uniref:Ribosomal protein L11 methyltransferase n=1 Tax=Balneatrix alpica TaxID=75684 RepID=A0ABV5ZGB9_9GAMM|nr:50S ribosomal protein L11 methyltransferase [Balneatrix alpica]
MSWLQMRLDIEPAQASQLEDLLLEVGAVSVTYQDAADQPIFEPDLGTTPLWQQTHLLGLFSGDTDIDAALTELQLLFAAHYPDQAFPPAKVEILEDKDWERAWMEHFHPIQFGQRLWVCPSWKEVPDPSAANLMLDPGLAFGTGSHPTTALCLEWLAGLDLQDKVVVDYGCGSGILGIAALLLGAKQVYAIDIDPQALEATRDNAERNQIASSRLLTLYPEQVPELHADVLVANILAGPLTSLAPTLTALVAEHGQLALSGLLSHQREQVEAAYCQDFQLSPAASKEDWIRIQGIRKSQ